jgi:membrane fusion protein, multidrug efflux system
MNIARIITNLLVVLGIGALVFYAVHKLQSNKKVIVQNAELAQERNLTIPVTTAAAANETISGDFNSIGGFEPYKQVTVIANASGKIISANFENGSFVKAGATLVAVDNEMITNELDITKINLEKAQNDVARLTKLIGEGGVTQQQVDDARIGIKNLEAKITAVNKQLSLNHIEAPISGIVSNKMVEKGGFVAPPMQVCAITNIAKLKMKVFLPEAQILSAKIGNKVRLTADLYPDKNFYGIVKFIDVKADMSKRFGVEIELDNSANKLKAGMSGTAYFGSGKSITALTVPREALVGSVQDAKMYIIENGIAKLRPIKAGTIYGNKLEIVSGVKLGETVVTAGQINLQDGAAVTVGK